MQCCAINATASKKAGLPYLTAEEVIEKTEKDTATWNIFAKGYTMGVNQCQGAKTIEKLMRYKPRSLQDMSAFVAAIRPGFKSMVNKFLAREKFSYGVPAFDEQLHNDSSGSSWLLYQEDVMKVLALAGFPLDETYPIIKAISKKKVKVIEAAHERFIEGFIAYQKEQGEQSDEKARENAEMVWQILYNSSSYSFNCLSGDTKFVKWSDSLKQQTVEEMWKESAGEYSKWFGVSMSGFHNSVPNTATNVEFAGHHIVYKLTLENGYNVTCTPLHKFPTASGEKALHDLTTNDWLYVYPKYRCEMELCRVKSIEYVGLQDVFNVTMSDPYHNFVVNDGIVTSNCSHSVAVALDAIYGAYLKAHYPLEYYTTLLDAYSAKGDKDKVALIKEEMRKAFNITISPCKFREDNRFFSFDRTNNSISDALPSIKNLSMAVAEELVTMKDNKYSSFVELLKDLSDRHPFNATNIEVLIKMDYFREFGHNGKLIEVYRQFRSGEGMAFKKTYVDKTQQKRLELLVNFEKNCPDEPISPYDQVSFESTYYGKPISVFPQCKATYSVIAVDTKYSPKLTLYSLVTGRTGVVKVKKDLFKEKPLDVGDIILLNGYQERPKYTYDDHKPVPIPGTKELWMLDYIIALHHDELKEA